MDSFIITIDSADKSKQAETWRQLVDLGKCYPILSNCWVIETEKTPVEIRDSLTDKDMGVLVVRSGTYSAWRNFYGKDNNARVKELL